MKIKWTGHPGFIIITLILILIVSCLPAPDSRENPAPADDPKAKLNLLELSFKINPIRQTVKLETKPGPDLEEAGEINAALAPYGQDPQYQRGYSFEDNLVLIFLKLEGTGLKKDLVEIKVQVMDLCSDSVFPQNRVMISNTRYNLISGFNEKTGLPYYDYGDFYAARRAQIYNSATPSNWLWALAFVLDDPEQEVEIKARVQAKFPFPDDARAKITIQPYLNHLTGNSVAILWETGYESHSKVHFGIQPTLLKKATTGPARRYQGPELLDPSQPPVFNLVLHQVVLRDLEPGRTYYYQVCSAKNPSPVYSFKTLSEEPGTFKFAVIGDTRTDDLAHSQVIAKMTEFDFDFYVHLGDFANNFYPPLRRNFFQIEQPLNSFIPIFPVRGNHDSVPWFKAYYHLPKNDFSPQLNELCYSFSYQGVYFIFLESIVYGINQGSTVYLWLENELAKAYADPKRKFTLIFNHSPFYSGYNNFYSPPIESLAYLAPLFRQYDVSAGFGGHIHLYERLEVSGKPYFVSGGGGAPLFEPGTNPDPALLQLESQYSGEQVQSLVQAWKYHFLLVEVGSDYFSVSAYDQDGTLFDQASYSK